MTERDPHLKAKSKHHGYVGLALMAFGLYVLALGFVEILTAEIGELWPAYKLLIIGSIIEGVGAWLFIDDTMQHAKQHNDPGYRSPVNKLYGKLLRVWKWIASLTLALCLVNCQGTTQKGVGAGLVNRAPASDCIADGIWTRIIMPRPSDNDSLSHRYIYHLYTINSDPMNQNEENLLIYGVPAIDPFAWGYIPHYNTTHLIDITFKYMTGATLPDSLTRYIVVRETGGNPRW